jgi:cell division protein FtsB
MSLFTRKGDGGVFDELFEWVEKLRSENRYPYGLEEILFAIEGVLQDLGDENIEKQVTRKVGFWFEVVFTDTDDDRTIEGFQVVLVELLMQLSQWESVSSDQLHKDIGDISPSPPDDWTPNNRDFQQSLRLKFVEVLDKRRGHEEFWENLVNSLDTQDHPDISMTDVIQHFLVTCAHVLPSRIQTGDDASKNSRSVWSAKISFQGSPYSATDVGRSLWSISSALESVPGVTVQIEEWGKGSLLVKLWIWVKNVWSGDQLIEVLDKGRDATIAALDKPTEETKKLQAEREKLDQEAKQLRQGIESNSPELARRSQELDVRMKEEELRALVLENKRRELDLMTQASELLSKGILVANKVRIDINDELYLLFDGEHVTSGADMKLIREKEKLLRPDEVPAAEKDGG